MHANLFNGKLMQLISLPRVKKLDLQRLVFYMQRFHLFSSSKYLLRNLGGIQLLHLHLGDGG